MSPIFRRCRRESGSTRPWQPQKHLPSLAPHLVVLLQPLYCSLTEVSVPSEERDRVESIAHVYVLAHCSHSMLIFDSAGRVPSLVMKRQLAFISHCLCLQLLKKLLSTWTLTKLQISSCTPFILFFAVTLPRYTSPTSRRRCRSHCRRDAPSIASSQKVLYLCCQLPS